MQCIFSIAFPSKLGSSYLHQFYGFPLKSSIGMVKREYFDMNFLETFQICIMNGSKICTEKQYYKVFHQYYIQKGYILAEAECLYL